MDAKHITMLKSKLVLYSVYYQKAELKKDHKRMDKLGIIIDELTEEITNAS